MNEIFQEAGERRKRRTEILGEAWSALQEGSQSGAAVESVSADYQAGRNPCWRICSCPEQVREECPAHRDGSRPCWEIAGTFCKLTVGDTAGDDQDTTVCQTCRVYRTYGDRKAIILGQIDKHEMFEHAVQRQRRRAEILGQIMPPVSAGSRARKAPRSKTCDFWTDKNPCWKICTCPEQVREECLAYVDRSRPCWEVAGAFCKLSGSDTGAGDGDTIVCQTCRVYKKYGAPTAGVRGI